MNVESLRIRLSTYPALSDLLAANPKALRSLAKVAEDSPNRSESDPLIGMIYGNEEDQARAKRFNAALEALRLPLKAQRTLARYLSAPDRRKAGSTAAELYVGGLLAGGGATVEFVPTRNDATPDLCVLFAGAELHIEVASVNLSDEDAKAHDERKRVFNSWDVVKPAPEILRGRASGSVDAAGRGMKMLESSVSPLGAGSLGDRIGRLARKKPSRQLYGKHNSVLVLSFWHVWGVGSEQCSPLVLPEGDLFTGALFAAAYGRRGDVVYEGCDPDEAGSFRGERSSQSVDGILQRSGSPCALVWLLQKDRPVVFENLDTRRAGLTEDARKLLERAFDLQGDTSSRWRVQRT